MGTPLLSPGKDPQGVFDLYVMNADGSGLTQLTDTPNSLDGEPDWSPDGVRIAFRSRRNQDAAGSYYCALYVMNADGTDLRNLTPIPDGVLAGAWCNNAPAWSRNGQHIYFKSQRMTEFGVRVHIYRINDDGGELKRLTHHPTAGNGWPSVRPRG